MKIQGSIGLAKILLLSSALVSSLSCGAGSERREPPKPQLSTPGVVSLAASATRGGGTWTVRWQLRNNSGATIWVPTRWGVSAASLENLPFPFIVPPDDLMLVYGEFQFNINGRGRQIIEGTPQIEAIAIPDGGTFDGAVDLARPYRPEGLLNNPFESGGNTVECKQVAALAGVQVAVQYWLFDPVPKRRTLTTADMRDDPAFRRTVAESLIKGENPIAMSNSSYAGLVLSNRVPLDLPLSERRSINFSNETYELR